MSSTEFTIPRPGYAMPWVAVIQFDQSQQDYAWGVYSQARVWQPRWTGHAPTHDAARQAAINATETH